MNEMYRQAGGRPTWWRRFIQWLVSQRAVSRFFSNFVHHVDRLFFRLSGGRFSVSGVLTGWPVVVLTATGAKSGQPRTVPLVGIPDGEKVVLIASNYGRQRSPAWYYNLKANPVAKLSQQGETRTYLAYEALGEERQRYWQLAVDVFPGYEDYRRRAGDRRIPVMVLQPMDV